MHKLMSLALLSAVTFSSVSFANPRRAAELAARIATAAARQPSASAPIAKMGMPFVIKHPRDVIAAANAPDIIRYSGVFHVTDRNPEAPTAEGLERIMRRNFAGWKVTAVMRVAYRFSDPVKAADAIAALQDDGADEVIVDLHEYDSDDDLD